MKTLRTVVIVLWVVCLVGLGGAFLIEKRYAGQAKLMQRVQPHEPAMAELLGEVGELVGSPQVMIVTDPEALIPAPQGYTGPQMVNEKVLKAKGVYPLQLKTVEFVAGMVRLGCLAGLLVLGLLAAWLRRKATAGTIQAT